MEEKIEGLEELLDANFGVLTEKEVRDIVEGLLRKYKNGPKTRNVARKFKQELRKELERRDPKRVLFTIDKGGK